MFFTNTYNTIIAIRFFFKYLALGSILLWGTIQKVSAQKAFIINGQDEHIFNYDEIEIYRHTSPNLSLNEIQKIDSLKKFTPNKKNTPQVSSSLNSDWFKIRIKVADSKDKRYYLEFFDQTIDYLTIYVPQPDGSFSEFKAGDALPFWNRFLSHKNFVVPLGSPPQDGIYYINIKSRQIADVIVVLRSESRFVKYALSEYLIFGIFYGMILVFSFYNIIMYFAIRQEQYLYYVLYILSVGLFEMCVDGLAYQYLWPSFPQWNQYAYSFALLGVSIFALQFTRSLLFTPKKAPILDRILIAVMGVRVLLFAYAWFIDRSILQYKFIELIPLSMAFYTGLHVYTRGYKPARYFVLGYMFLTLGFVYKLLIMLQFNWLNFGIMSYYSLSICFIIEMLFLSFAVGDKVRYLKTRKEKWQKEMMIQMQKNGQLKDELNERLEKEVENRTQEIQRKTEIIAQKNDELSDINQKLNLQAKEIQRMNALLQEDNLTLQKDNNQLKTNVEEVKRARVLSVEVDFDEFSQIYPDQESCIKFLEDLKASKDYKCYKCGKNTYSAGRSQGSRRCTHCGYEESVTAHTLLQNTRIPINKAFYIIFLMYSTKGKISSHKLSEMVSIRQSTCWAYSNRIKEVMFDKKRKSKNHTTDSKAGWASLLFED